MARNRLVHPALAVAFLLNSPVAVAAEYFVEKATGPGISSSDLETITELVKNSVSDQSGNSVTDRRGSAEFTLRPKLLKLGNAFVMTLEKIRDEKAAFSSQMKAAAIDEMDVVARRLTRSVISEIAVTDDTRVGEVTDHETRDGSNRRPARKGYFVGLGPSILANLNSDAVGYNLNGGYAWDVNVVMMKILFDGSFNSEAGIGSVGLGGSYFLSDANNTSYISADLNYGAAKARGDSEPSGGFLLGVGGGMQFLRTSAINIEVGGRVGMLFDSNQYGMPMSFTLKVGFYF